MRFTPTFLDDIRQRVSISSVVGRRVSWDRRKTQAGRGSYWGCCPFHNEKSASFHVQDDKGRYHCFGCKASGDIFTFLVEKEGLSFPEAVERLAREAGLPLPEGSTEEDERHQRRASLFDVMELASRFFEEALQLPQGARARGYLADRQLPAAVQREFRLGYAPADRSALRTFLADRQVTVERMAEAGLVISGDDIPLAYDRFRDRVMFPIGDGRGRVIAFGGRALSSDAQAKYLNSPETPLFSKRAVLYNLDKARAAAHAAGHIVAVEGYMDVIAMHRAGVGAAVAPLGTALTQDQLGAMWRLAPEPILCFDGDAAGFKAAHRALDLSLPLLKPGHSLRFALLPEGQDPDDLLKSEGPEAIKAVIAAAEPLSDMLWRRALAENDRSTPERRAQFEQDLGKLIGEIGDETVRTHYASEFRGRLQTLWSAGTPDRLGQQRTRAPGQRRTWRKPWEVPQPASPQLRALARAGSSVKATERREQMILLNAINHPALLNEMLDDFAAADFASRELDSLRREILDSAALQGGLDGPSLRSHLSDKGFGPLLARLDANAARLNEWFLGSGAASADARTGFRQMIALHRKTTSLGRELKAAEAAFAGDPTEETLAALNAVREQMASASGSEAQIEGFGEASGRPSDTIA